LAFGCAAELALSDLEREVPRIRQLRDRLEAGLLGSIPDSRRNGAAEPRLANTLNVSFAGVEAEAVLMLLDQAGVCASSGSACTTGSLDPSHVLTAMGVSRSRARGSLRLSLGRYTTDADVDLVLELLPRIVAKLRSLAPLNPHRPDLQPDGRIAT
jgi:cysteine desulfurase